MHRYISRCITRVSYAVNEADGKVTLVVFAFLTLVLQNKHKHRVIAVIAGD